VGDENSWYQNHLEALKTEEVMYNISTPMMRELRGNFYLMLKRVAEK
jgi:hypothetical protein